MKNDKEEKENRLLNTAFRLFTEKGIKETSIQEIVDNASVAKGTFYLYFRDKFIGNDDGFDKFSARVFLRFIGFAVIGFGQFFFDGVFVVFVFKVFFGQAAFAAKPVAAAGEFTVKKNRKRAEGYQSHDVIQGGIYLFADGKGHFVDHNADEKSQRGNDAENDFHKYSPQNF